MRLKNHEIHARRNGDLRFKSLRQDLTSDSGLELIIRDGTPARIGGSVACGWLLRLNDLDQSKVANRVIGAAHETAPIAEAHFNRPAAEAAH